MDDLVLYAVVCAAPPVTRVRTLIHAAQDRGYDVCLIATPTAANWLDDDLTDLSQLTGHPVRSSYKHPTEPDVLPPADAMIVAPLTFNTLNKWAAGISDTLAAGLINEALGKSIPVVAAAYINEALTAHPAVASSIATLQSAGVTMLNGHGDAHHTYTPDTFPWEQTLNALDGQRP